MLYRNAVMVVDVVLGGTAGGIRFRVATRALRSLAGAALDQDRSVRAGLLEEPTLSSSYTLGEAASQARSLTFTIRPDVQLSIARLIASGCPPVGVAEVSIEHLPEDGSDTTQYSQRVVVMRGVVDGLKFGGLFPDRTAWGEAGNRRARGYEIVEFEVTDPRQRCQSWLPPWIIDSDGKRFTAPHSSAVGQRMSIVYNGFTNIPAIRVTSVTPGIQQFIYAAGPTAFTVSATVGVKVNGVTKTNVDAVYAWANEQTTDGMGTQISRIRFTVAGTAWVDGDAVHVSATATNSSDSLQIISIIMDLCEQYSPLGTIGLNQRLFSDAASRLPVALQAPNVLVNGSGGGSSAGALDFIEQTLCAQFPMVSMVWEDGGYGPIVTDYRLQAQATLTAGVAPLLKRASLVQTAGPYVNAFTFRYAYDPLLDSYTKVAVRNATNSGVCAYSEAYLGQCAEDPIESPYIQDDATVAYILDWLVAHKALPSFIVEYECAPVVFFTLRRGDTVLLNDEEFRWSSQRATIEGVEYSRGRAKLTLRVFARFVNVAGSAISVPFVG
jgi:hypothetical protein